MRKRHQLRTGHPLAGPRYVRFTLATWLLALLAVNPATAQMNPVYVDDSPLAREMFARAMDHAGDNVGEAVRLLQELLDEYPDRLIPATPAHVGVADRYVTVRGRVLDALRSRPPLLARYQLAEDAHARRLLEAGMNEQLVTTRPLTAPGLEAMLRLAQRDLERGRFNAALRWLDEAIEHPDLSGRDELSIENERRVAHAWHMIGLAAAGQDRQHRVEHAIEELERIGRRGGRADILRDDLERKRHVAVPSRSRSGETAFDRTLAIGLDELIAEEIWSVEMTDSLHQRRERNTSQDRPIMGRSLNQSREEGHFLTVAPTVRDNVVYINQGHRVSAIDRMSGTPIWHREYVDRPSLSVIDREDQQPRDLNIIAVDGDALVTLTGHAYGTDRSSDGRLIRLDAATGELVWAAKLSDLRTADGELDDLFPHSAPVIVDDRVILLARRVSRQSLSSTYLVSYNIESGEPVWVRHIVSSSSTHRASRAFSTVAVYEGDVYINSPVGAAARVDAATGHLRWLHRFPVAITPHTSEQGQRPWELLAPIVLPGDRAEDGTVVAVAPGYRRITVIDRSTGVVLRSIDATSAAAAGGGLRPQERGPFDEPAPSGWQSPQYLLAGSRYIIAVGREISAYNPEQLDEPVWRLPLPSRHGGPPTDQHINTAGGDAAEQWIGTYEPYGRVQIAQDLTAPVPSRSWLIVPTREGVYVIDEESGLVRIHLPIRSPGNVLASDAQLLIAGNDTLKAYMSLSRAEELMRDRVARLPSDPAPALGLLRLGVRVGRIDLVMEASELTMRAVDAAIDRLPSDGRSPASSRAGREAAAAADELIELLIGMDMEYVAKTRDEAESLFALIERMVHTPEQRVAAAIKRGDWYAQHETGRVGDLPWRAIEAWQEILADRELGRVVDGSPLTRHRGQEVGGAQTTVNREPTTDNHSIIRPARIVAQQRIAQLMAELGDPPRRGGGGSRLYAVQEEFASMRLRMLTGGAVEAGSRDGMKPPSDPGRSGSLPDAMATSAPLMDLVREFPLSTAAVKAGTEQARRLAARGEVDRALDALAVTYQSATGDGLWAMGHDNDNQGHGRDAPTLPPGLPSPREPREPRGDAGVELDRREPAMLLEQYVTMAVEHDRRAAAVDMLRFIQDARHSGRRQRTGQWAADELAQLAFPGNRQPPRVGAAERQADMVGGVLVPTAAAAEWTGPRVPNDAVLVAVDDVDPSGREQRRLVMYRLRESAVEHWSVPMVDTEPRIVLWTDEQIVIQFEDRGGRLRIESLSPRDGSRQWVAADVDELAGQREIDPALGAAETGRVVSRSPSALRGGGSGVSIVPLISRDHLVLVRSDGFVAGFELAADDGDTEGRRNRVRQPAWTVRNALDVVSHAQVQDGRVILGGMRRAMGDGPGRSTASGARGGRSRATSVTQPAIAVLDVRRGGHRIDPFSPPFAGSEIAWMRALPLGMLVYASDEGVTKIDVRSGELVWANRSYAAAQSPRGWVTGLDVVLEDRRGNLRRLHVDSGRLGSAFDVPDHGDWNPLRLVDVMADGDAIIARYRQRFVRYDIDGRVIGADMILDDRADEWLLRAEDRFILVSNLTDRGDGRLQLQEEQTMYRVYPLSPNGRLLGEGIDLTLPHLLTRIDEATLRDGWLLLSVGDWTITLPMPVQ